MRYARRTGNGRTRNGRSRPKAIDGNQPGSGLFLSGPSLIDEITGEIEAVAVKAFQATASKAADGGLANTADRSNDVEFGSDSPLTFAVLPHSADLVRTARDWDGFIARSKRRDSRGGLRAKFEHGLLSTRWAMATPLLERPLRSRLLNRLSTGKQPAVS